LEAKESQKPQPNQQIINLLSDATSLHQQAAEEEAAGQNEKAVSLNEAGKALWFAVLEAQEPNSNPETSKQIIKLFTDSASLRQQVGEAIAAGQDKKAEYLNKAATALLFAAFEAQKLIPNQERIQQHLKEAEDWKMRAEQPNQACIIS